MDCETVVGHFSKDCPKRKGGKGHAKGSPAMLVSCVDAYSNGKKRRGNRTTSVARCKGHLSHNSATIVADALGGIRLQDTSG